jgi:hypothetical protein
MRPQLRVLSCRADRSFEHPSACLANPDDTNKVGIEDSAIQFIVISITIEKNDHLSPVGVARTLGQNSKADIH